jgi:RimJ/RimL family protein N-acetyltransferase
MMAFYKKLVGEKCYLSPCSLEDAGKWTQWLNDLEVAIPLGDEAYTQPTLDQQREMIGNISKGHYHVFTIVALKDDEAIGRCILFNIDQVNRRGMLGIFIGEKGYWNRGFGQDAIKLLLDYGFNLLNLNNIMLGTISFNERATSCYKKVGFREIGRRREARIIGGKKYDVILMDILADEFKSVYVDKFVTEE